MKPPAAKKNKRRKKKGASASAPLQGDAAAAAAAPSAADGGESMEGKEEEEAVGGGGVGDEERVLNWLVDAFSSTSLEQVFSAYREAQGDPLKVADILGTSSEGSTTSESSSSREAPAAEERIGWSRKQKKVAASTGLVPDVIGKGYGGSVYGEGGRRRTVSAWNKGPWNERYTLEEAEEFLCSVVGGTCELDPAVVKDVFGHCGYDVEKTLDTLLDMSASSSNWSRENNYDDYNKLNYSMTCPKEFSGHLKDHITKFQAIDKTSGSGYRARLQVHELPQSIGYNPRVYSKVHRCSDDHSSSEAGASKLDLQQKVLEYLFNVPNTSQPEPSRMNWKEALKKVESFSQGMDFNSTGITEQLQKLANGKDDGYVVFRSVAVQHWETMKSYYQRAAVAYSKGEQAHASYLSEKGRSYGKLAREADEKASREIFEARNKDIRNAVTIDLHGQHVKQAVKLLKLHLLLFTYIPSIQFLRVITGCGTHGVGRGKLKQSVIGLVQKEGIEWSEDNPGTLVLRIDGPKEYSFMTSDSDSE